MHQKILEIAKRRGIVYPSFEPYGGISGFYDYGPIGKRIKENIEAVIRDFYLIQEQCVEVECPTLSPEKVWIASGHVKSFSDMLTECENCGEAYRADHLIEIYLKISCDGKNKEDLEKLIEKHKIKCPKCKGNLSEVYHYNLMFKTEIGPGKDKVVGYLRPETAQTTYLSFRRLWEVCRKKLPLGVLQIGNSFRNEISPRQGMIRLREFSQAEVQFFVDPEKKFVSQEKFKKVKDLKVRIIDKQDKEFNLSLEEAFEKKIIKIQLIAYSLGRALQLFEKIGIDSKKLKLRQHKDEERAFYSTDTWDIEFFSENFGRIELVGVSDRTDYDLSAHMNLSGEDFSITYEGKKFIPHVIEVAYGIDRPFYCVLESCYIEENGRNYFKFPNKIAPYLAAVFPLVNKDGIPEKAQDVFKMLKKKHVYSFYDLAGSIGKRYARADEIGVPFSITIDYDTLADDTVTVRDRNNKEQKRVKISDLYNFLLKKKAE
jgi:glycyl-tRNA synthetase